MKFAQEKKKLETLSQTAVTADNFNDQNFDMLSDVYREYSAIVTDLYKKEPNIFGNFRNYSIPEIKDHRRSIVKIDSLEYKNENYKLFKECLEQSIESTIDYIVNYVTH